MTSTSPTMVTSADGVRLAVYGTEGAGTGLPTVVAVHGYPDNAALWQGPADQLAGRVRLVRYDVRGFGASDAPATRAGYRTERLVDDLAAVVDAVSPDGPVHLLGHDWGSIQCWPAVTDPRLAGRLASWTSVSGPSLDHIAAWVRDVRAHPRAVLRQLGHSYYTALFQVPVVPERLARAGMVDRMIRLASRGARDPRAARVGGHRGERDLVNGLELYRANLFTRSGAGRPQPIDIPVQVVLQDRDAYLTPQVCAEAPEPWCRDLSLRTLPGGHWYLAERPDVLARVVTGFVDHLAGAPRPRRLVRPDERRRAPLTGRLALVLSGSDEPGRALAAAGAAVTGTTPTDGDDVADLVVLDLRGDATGPDTAAWQRCAEAARAAADRGEGGTVVVLHRPGGPTAGAARLAALRRDVAPAGVTVAEVAAPAAADAHTLQRLLVAAAAG